jgi:6-phosphogluconolactonase (cycloisomerase 2 family)
MNAVTNTEVSLPTTEKTEAAGAFWFAAAMLLALALFLSTGASAQGSYVYVNNQAATNTVSAYSVSSAGALTQITGSPFNTGGRGGNVTCVGLKRIVLNAPNNLLFVANTLDMSISAFTIAPATGALTSVAGSPFASGLTADGCGGMSLAVTPDGKFLMASSNGKIQTFPIAGGVLGAPVTTLNPAIPTVGMEIAPNGQILAISNQGSVAVFTINTTTGALTPAAGSPFPKTGTGNISGLEFSCASDRLYGGEAVSSLNQADGWTVNPTTGVLTAAPGSPFKATSGTNSNIVALTPDNTLVLESNQLSISLNTFNVNSNGSLTSVGKFGGTGTVHTPTGVAVDSTGTYAFVADDTFGIATFRIGIGGALTSVADLAINRPGQIQDLAVYPAKSCQQADLSLTMTAAPNPVLPGASISYTVTVTNNDAANTAALVVSDNLPAGTTFGGTATIIASTGAARLSGVTTITTSKPHGLTVGEKFTIGGVSDTSFNGNFVVATVVSPTVFTYAQATLPNKTSGGGSVTYAACSVTGTGNTCGGLALNRFATIPALGPGKSETITFVTTVSSATANGTLLTNTAVISNKSTLDANPVNNSVTLTTLVNTPAADILTVPAATGTFGGNATLTAILTNKPTPPTAPTGISGETLVFTFAGSNYIGVTDGTGTASVIVPLGTLAGGTHPSAFTVTFAGDANFTATGGTGTLTVGPAQLLVTADNISRPYGGVSATAWAASTAFTVGQFIVDTNGNVQQVTTAGTTGAAAPTWNTVDRATTIDGTVVWTNRSAVLPPAGNPPLTYTFSGLVNGDTIAVVTGDASCTTTAVATSVVGPYPITCTVGTLAATNYTIVMSSGTSSNATLTVTAAPLTVVVDNQTRTYGAANPTFTGTITGLVGTDVVTATYASVATVTSPVGTYPILPTLSDPGSVLGNYTVTTTNGALIITGAPLTVTAASATRVYGDPNPALTGTITGLQNGETIAVTYSTPATQPSPVGTYPIIPSVTDPNNVLSNYILTIVNGTLTITPAPLNATAASASRVYGDPNPAFTGTLTGLKNGDPITATFVSAATPASPVGTYAITPVLSDPSNLLGNYTLTSVNGTLTITPAPLSATAAGTSRVYGDPNPVFTGALTGLKNGDPISATFVSAATPASPVGTYAITPVLSDPSGLLGNYTVTFNNGTLTVTPAPLTVQAADAAKAAGDPNPAFTGTITGLKNSDPISATYSSPADATSPAGTYPIIPALVDPSGLLGNYSVTIINGTLTVS